MSLKRHAQVLERAAKFIPTAGAGFGFSPNGQACLGSIGFSADIDAGTCVHSVRVCECARLFFFVLCSAAGCKADAHGIDSCVCVSHPTPVGHPLLDHVMFSGNKILARSDHFVRAQVGGKTWAKADGRGRRARSTWC